MPWEYVEFKLIKDLYHCTPEELEKQKVKVLVRHWNFMQAEAHEAEIQRKRAEQKARMRR